MAQGSKILGQTGTAKRKSRLEICRRYIETRVGFENVCDSFRLNAHCIADGADLIGESDLQRMERIARVLNHFSRGDRNFILESADEAVEVANRNDLRFIICTDDGKRWVEKICNGCAFSQKLRIEAHEKIVPGFPTASPFDRGHHNLFRSAWKDSTAKNDPVE